MLYKFVHISMLPN